VPEDASLSLLHLADLEDPRVGEQVLALAAGQTALGHTVAVAGPLNRRLQERLRRLQERLRRLEVRWSVLPWPDVAQAPPPAGAAPQLARLVVARPPDLIHAHGLTALQAATQARGLVPGDSRPALIASLYQVPRRLPFRERRRWRRLLGPVLREDSALLLPSQADRQALIALVGRRGERAEVVYPAVPETARPSGVEVGQLRRRLGITSHAAVVGCRTSFDDAEYETFLRAAARVHAALPNVEFAFLGEGPRRPEAQARAHELGLTGATVFLGRPRSRAEALSALNALVVLSDADAAHLDALQALGYGLPVIAARAGVLAELLGSLPGTQLVPPDDPEALAAALLRALHLIPRAGAEDQIETESGRVAALDQFLVSTEFWDLDQPWQRTAHHPAPPASAFPEALRPFLPAAATERVLAVYRRVLRRRD
jgi:glycosyltransferase involved in cell wall biosynthesis